MRLRKRLLIALFIPLLLTSLTIVVSASENPTPAQAVWVDPKFTECLTVGETFVVDVLVNITAPTSPSGTGMMGWEYKLFWDPSVIDVASYTLNVPPGMAGFLVADNWDVSGRHFHAYTNLMGTPFTGVASLCTYTFEVLDVGSSDLDLQEVKIVDDTASIFITDTTDPDTGTIDDGSFCQVAFQYELSISVVGSGTTNPSPEIYLYAESTVVPIDAIPDFGWMLDHWELNNVDVGDTDPYSVTMDGNYTLMAVFVEKPPSVLVADLNSDGIVDIFDGIIIAVAFGSRPGGQNWNPIADLVEDEFIDIQDIVVWAQEFGQTL